MKREELTQQLQKLKAAEENEAEEGGGTDCEICDRNTLPHRLFRCRAEEPHLCCRQCLRQFVDVSAGEGEIPCAASNCDALYSRGK